MLRNLLFIILWFSTITVVSQQDIAVGGACEGCEAIFENKIPFEQLNHEITLSSLGEKGTPLTITGKVFKLDGKTPAANVILYVYHTDQHGKYTALPGASGWEKRHGSIRGWLKTNATGDYIIHTLKPAHYPSEHIAAHIHIFLKEPGKTPYWIEEYLFQGDPFLTANEINNTKPRGSDGVLKTTLKNGALMANRDIILGLNIPNYK